MKRILIIIFCLTFFSCSNSENPAPSTKELAFKKFVSRQKLIDLPIYFNLDAISDEQTQPMIVDDSDTLFIPTDFASGRICGIYKDTSQYYAFVTLGAAAVYTPQIRIFDKHGNKIQEVELLVDGCGADCGYFCNAVAKVYQDYPNPTLSFMHEILFFLTLATVLLKKLPGQENITLNLNQAP